MDGRKRRGGKLRRWPVGVFRNEGRGISNSLQVPCTGGPSSALRQDGGEMCLQCTTCVGMCRCRRSSHFSPLLLQKKEKIQLKTLRNCRQNKSLEDMLVNSLISHFFSHTTQQTRRLGIDAQSIRTISDALRTQKDIESKNEPSKLPGGRIAQPREGALIEGLVGGSADKRSAKRLQLGQHPAFEISSLEDNHLNVLVRTAAVATEWLHTYLTMQT
eukprot:766214-Hanusia_phi.AAC.2